MISSFDIKEAIMDELSKFIDEKEVAIYREVAEKPVFYPNLFIYIVSVLDSEDRKNHHSFTYSIDIRYRVDEDVSTDLKLQQKLDEMGLKLLKNFNIIAFNDSFVRCSNKRLEKVDGVLHFYFNIDLNVIEKSEKENVKFDRLNFNSGVRK